MLSNSILLSNLFFTSSLSAALVIRLSARTSRRELAAILGIGVLLLGWFGVSGAAYKRVMVGAGYFGVAALLTTLLAVVFFDRSLPRIKLLAEMAVGPVSIVILVFALAVSSGANPVYDRYLYAFDGSFGFQPGFLAARTLLAHDWLRMAGEIAYINLPLAIGAIYVVSKKQSAQGATEFFRAVAAIGAVGYLCYLIFPAVGSAAAFRGAFPFREPALEPGWVMPVSFGLSPRNCIPSLHTSWAIALWRTGRSGSGAIRCALGCYLFFLLFETLACGHYLIDLIAAVPFTLAIRAASASFQPGKLVLHWKPLLAGIALFAGLLLLIRFGWDLSRNSPAIPVLFSALTIAICGWAERQSPLSRAPQPAVLEPAIG